MLSQQTIEILSSEELRRTINRIASQIVEHCADLSNLVLLGIHTRGVPLSEIIASRIQALEGTDVPLGALDITFYRDDLDKIGLRAPNQTHIPFDLNGKVVVLIDDVIYSGRTIKAALSTIHDYGRPQVVRLAVLVDRGHREVPIHPDFVGKVLPTAKDEQVRVLLNQVDGQDGVELIKTPKT